MAEEGAPELKRDSTMAVTAQEGAEFLKRSGAEDLIAKPDEEKPPVQRDTTIAATVKEAEAYLEAQGKVEGSTRAESAAAEAAAAESEPPKIPKDNTMVETAKEGKEILGDEPIAETRAQTKVLQDAVEEAKEDEEDDEEANPLKRTHTMAETLQEGEEFLKKQKTSNGDAAEQKEEAEPAADGGQE